MSNPYAEPQSHTHCQLLGKRFSRTTLRNSLRLTLFAFAVSLVLYFSPRASAVNRTWDGGGTTYNWSEAANWSGDTAPGAGDIAIFDGTSTKDATIDTNFSVQGVQLNAGYTGTITQAAGIQLAVGSSNYSQSAGTFTGGSGSIDINGVFTLSGGTFTASSGVSSFDHFSHTRAARSSQQRPVTFDNPAVNPELPTATFTT